LRAVRHWSRPPQSHASAAPRSVPGTSRGSVSPAGGRSSRTHRPELPMPASARLFNCARCNRQVVICRHCDRGQRYCGPACARAARRASTRAAGARYQHSRRGRLKHAHRQGRYRTRRRKVTHQGSLALTPGASLPPESRAPAPPTPRHQAHPPVADGLRCHVCGRVCTEFVRLGFLRQRRDGPVIPRPPRVRAHSP
jgi:hypothetical protein